MNWVQGRTRGLEALATPATPPAACQRDFAHHRREVTRQLHCGVALQQRAHVGDRVQQSHRAADLQVRRVRLLAAQQLPQRSTRRSSPAAPGSAPRSAPHVLVLGLVSQRHQPRHQRQRGAHRRARQRQFRVSGTVALHAARVAQEARVEHAPRDALEHLVPPALGLQHLCARSAASAGSSAGSGDQLVQAAHDVARAHHLLAVHAHARHRHAAIQQRSRGDLHHRQQIHAAVRASTSSAAPLPLRRTDASP